LIYKPNCGFGDFILYFVGIFTHIFLNIQKIFYISFSLLIAINAFSQDIHFTQFYNVPTYHNPALTGVYGGDIRMTGNYRNQWSSVPVPYSTFQGSFEQKISIKQLENNVLGAGIILYHDQAGDSELSRTNIALSSAYVHQLSKKHFLSVGIQFGVGQRRLQTDKLTFDAQFNGDIFDPNLSTNENFSNQNIIFVDINTGVNWHFQIPEKRISVDAGFSLAHLNRPRQSFFKDNIRLSRRFVFFADATASLTDIWELQPSVLLQRQGTYQEVVYGTNIKYHLNKTTGNERGVYAGMWHRMGDALAFSVGIDYLNLRVGLSYDVNISPFQTATNRAGGPEISVIYTITKVKTLEEYKSCPIF